MLTSARCWSLRYPGSPWFSDHLFFSISKRNLEKSYNFLNSFMLMMIIIMVIIMHDYDYDYYYYYDYILQDYENLSRIT